VPVTSNTIVLDNSTGLVGYPEFNEEGNLILKVLYNLGEFIDIGTEFIVKSDLLQMNGVWAAIRISNSPTLNNKRFLIIEAIRSCDINSLKV
jgi:hypothetical protein